MGSAPDVRSTHCHYRQSDTPSSLMNNKILRITATAFAALAAATSASAISVGLELVLLTDVSGSVSATEYNLQKTGYVTAFQSAAVQNAILNSVGGSIAVTYIEWSGTTQQAIKVGWTEINSAASANAFAASLAATSRSFSGSTAPGSAINFASVLFGSNGFEAPRQVIDVSGDGSQNVGANTAAARDAALLAGVDAINGLPILGSEANLLSWYQNNIQGGTGSFTLAAASFGDFQAAIENKLIAEISGNGVPDGGSTVLMLAGLAFGWAAVRRRRV